MVKVKKKLIAPTVTRILVFGTFDILHKGHFNFFKQARKLARHPYLIVSVARDVNVKKIKGKQAIHPETARMRLLQAAKIADKVILGDKVNYMGHIKKSKPDIIALGYDQVAYTKNLRSNLRRAGLATKVMRLQAYKPHVYKSSLIKKNVV